MKEELIRYIIDRIDWHKREQERLRKDYRGDEATRMQIAVNVYNIFLSTYQVMKYDLDQTLIRFSAIVETWNKNHALAAEHNELEKQLIEELKISRAEEIIARAKELERMHHD